MGENDSNTLVLTRISFFFILKKKEKQISF